MAMFVHLTPRANISRVRRSGLGTAVGHGGVRGVFCFPVLPSYTVTHQWLRELARQHGPRGLVGVYLRLPDDEPVTVGHYNDSDGPKRVTAAEAVRVVAGLDDPRGWEVFVPRKVPRGEVHRIREVRQVTGWRYFPDSHGTTPCTCWGCRVNGGYGSQRLLERHPHPEDGPPPPPRVLLERISEASDRGDTMALREALSWLGHRRRGPLDRITALSGHPEPLVRATLAEAITPWATPGVDTLLACLAEDADPKVREAATLAAEIRSAASDPG